MPVVKYSVGNYEELNGELGYKKRNVRREEHVAIAVGDGVFNGRDEQNSTTNRTSRDFTENGDDLCDSSERNADYRTQRASSVTYCSSSSPVERFGILQFQKQNRNFLDVFPSTNAASDLLEAESFSTSSSRTASNGVGATAFATTTTNHDNVMDVAAHHVNVRRHSSASCCVTEMSDAPISTDYPRMPPPIPARLNKPPPAVPERRRLICSRSVVKENGVRTEDFPSNVGHHVVGNNINNGGIVERERNNSDIKIGTTTSRFDNSTVPIKIPPPPQSTHLKRSACSSSSIGNTNKQPTIIGRTSAGNVGSSSNNKAEPNAWSNQSQRMQHSDVKSISSSAVVDESRQQSVVVVVGKREQEKVQESYFKFPAAAASSSENSVAGRPSGIIGTDDKYDDQEEENDSTKCGLTLVRKKSGKKVPPPIQTYTAVDHQYDQCDQYHQCHQYHNQHPSKATAPPIRHDSTLSCSDGGISQTSSPSYLVRSLESPLLPKVRSHSTNRYVKKKFIADRLLFSDANEFSSSSVVKRSDSGSDLVVADLTKSQSTPCGLQTAIVEYRQQKSSSDSPYQNKVIQVTRKASISNSQLRFQFVQIIINVLVLIAVAAGLACYFRAYPMTITTIKYINHTTTYIHNASHGPGNYMYYPDFQFNQPTGYICSPFMARFCKVYKIPYNVSIFPNLIGSLNDREAEADLEIFEAIANVRCYQLAPLFLCSVYQPKCGANGLPVQPCKRLCEDMNDRCGIFLEVFGLQLPRKIDCSELPVSDDPEKCVGSKEIKQLELQELTLVCSDGFKCDRHRCIPADWRCDGHIDCEDETDELNCNQCPGQLHCGMGQCIATSHICDGILNCPWGQDERNCVRASVTMGDVGYGDVEIFVPSEKSFRRACVTSWDYKHSPRLICDLLGYEQLNNTELYSDNSKFVVSQVRYNPANVLNNKIKLFQELKKCNLAENHPIVRASCKSYVCGIRKQSFGFSTARIVSNLSGSTRIVGGVQSNPGDWPFLAAILGGPKEVFYCAGVLISDQWVLSAAHCVGNFNLSHPPKDWTIQLGMTRRFSHSYFGQKIKVRRVIPHPSYNLGIPHDNDVALFQLTDRVRFHDHLLPVCMPSDDVKLVPPRNCTVIGWGKREDSESLDYEPTVYEVQVPILHRNLCNKWLKKRNLNVTPNMLCAGYEEGGKDACQGDSGGPLLCQDNDNPSKWFVAGIVSWGIKCAHPHLPGIYANVPQFVRWIDHQVKFYSY